MIALNKYISKVGADKVMHLLGGGWIHDAVVLVSSIFSGTAGYLIVNHLATIVVYLLSLYKEKILDDKQDSPFDKVDIKFALKGSALSLIKNDIVYIIYIIVSIWL